MWITLGVAAVFATSLLSKSAQVRTAELARQGSRADKLAFDKRDELWYK